MKTSAMGSLMSDMDNAPGEGSSTMIHDPDDGVADKLKPELQDIESSPALISGKEYQTIGWLFEISRHGSSKSSVPPVSFPTNNET